MQRLKDKLTATDMAPWRKALLFAMQVLVVLFGVVHFMVFFDAGEEPATLMYNFGALVATTAAVQVTACWFGYRHAVPAYLAAALSGWVLLTVLWQSLMLTVFSAALR
jgi:hypothetical protein